ncbi:hypothetical protein ACIQFZ_43575, partial [Streptomyces sp. NPDC093064]|uniref:hypothetical protein n=1 Tax=Streptomyces sp. NPDC093064 TaxID=3366020 RepID=UPI0038000A28
MRAGNHAHTDQAAEFDPRPSMVPLPPDAMVGRGCWCMPLFGLVDADRKIDVREGRRQHPGRLRAGCRGELGQADTG